ncbi:MAG TPA: ABC transporter ATP-binding protein/permease [Pirellulales bacterium]|jgi:putative ATP-binding cassette transporter
MPKFAPQNLWNQFVVLAAPYWAAERKWRARFLLLLLIILLLGQTCANVLTNKLTGEFTSALAAHETHRFWGAIIRCLLLFLVAVPLNAFFYFVRDKLGILWRRALTNRFLGGYLRNRTYYHLNANAEVDNPDQRIADDIDSFTQRSLYFAMIGLGALLQLIAFSGVLASISIVLVLLLIAYAIVGTVATIFGFGKVLVGLNYSQLKREADFRFALIRIRENAESIAFYRGETNEGGQLKQRFNDLFVNFGKLIGAQLNLNLFQYGYSNAAIVIPSMVLAPRVISGELEIGRVTEAAGAFAATLQAVTVIIDKFDILAKFGAGVRRLHSFATTMEVLNGKSKGPVIVSADGPDVVIENVTLQTPDYGRTLIEDLSLKIGPSADLIIVGSSGGGKSSLLRAIGGLWTSGTGRIIRPDAEGLLFLPQHPYMILGTLRDQMLYPKMHKGRSDEELLELLKAVNLGELADRCGGLDIEMDWGKVLSLGEQQRLAIARLLLANPRYAMLDEATSALDTSNESIVYQRLKDSGTILVSISHRLSILRFHQQVLQLTGNGKWKLHSVKDFRVERD